MRRLGVFALCASLAGCAGESGAGEQVSPARSAVHHGVRSNDPAVVALIKHRTRCDETDQEIVCSGVLIAERLVLTAAHCLSGLPRGELEVRFGEQASLDPSNYRGISGSSIHPQYDREHDDHDLGLVWLDAPGPAQPVSAVADDDEWLPAAGVARAVGFGDATGEGGASGAQREGSVQLTSLSDYTLNYEPDPAMTCHGDSGGPVFVQKNGEWVLVGITTSGDAACERVGVAVRVDAHEADFVGPARLETALPPDPSVELDNLCAAECSSNADCPADLVCQSDSEGGQRCRARNLVPGRLAESCQSDGECSGGACVPVAGACRCSRPCPQAESPGPSRSSGCALNLAESHPVFPSALLFGAFLWGRRRR